MEARMRGWELQLGRLANALERLETARHLELAGRFGNLVRPPVGPEPPSLKAEVGGQDDRLRLRTGAGEVALELSVEAHGRLGLRAPDGALIATLTPHGDGEGFTARGAGGEPMASIYRQVNLRTHPASVGPHC